MPKAQKRKTRHEGLNPKDENQKKDFKEKTIVFSLSAQTSSCGRKRNIKEKPSGFFFKGMSV